MSGPTAEETKGAEPATDRDPRPLVGLVIGLIAFTVLAPFVGEAILTNELKPSRFLVLVTLAWTSNFFAVMYCAKRLLQQLGIA